MKMKVSASCERNKAPIWQILAQYLKSPCEVLELGSGSGQHGVFFTSQMLGLVWQTSDLEVNHNLINETISEFKASNVKRPLLFEVGEVVPTQACDHAFTANTFHIMPEKLAYQSFKDISSLLNNEGCYFVYGPFKYKGEFTSESNKAFDLKLKGDDSVRGIRDFEKIYEAAREAGFELVKDHDMPANNQLLVFQKE